MGADDPNYVVLARENEIKTWTGSRGAVLSVILEDGSFHLFSRNDIDKAKKLQNIDFIVFFGDHRNKKARSEATTFAKALAKTCKTWRFLVHPGENKTSKIKNDAVWESVIKDNWEEFLCLTKDSERQTYSWSTEDDPVARLVETAAKRFLQALQHEKPCPQIASEVKQTLAEAFETAEAYDLDRAIRDKLLREAQDAFIQLLDDASSLKEKEAARETIKKATGELRSGRF